MESEKNVPLEDQNVPAAHQGLHGFLYNSEDEHRSTPSSTPLVSQGTELVPVEQWRSYSHRVKVAGVYAVLDADRQVQYIGYSRDVQLSLEGHIAQQGVEACAFMQVQTFKFPKRQAMEALRDEWIAALGQVPSGNQAGTGAWASTIGEVAQASMSAAERQAYEDKKLKLRKAMADTTLSHELEPQETLDDSEAEQRRKLKAALENDDWSGVVET